MYSEKLAFPGTAMNHLSWDLMTLPLIMGLPPVMALTWRHRTQYSWQCMKILWRCRSTCHSNHHGTKKIPRHREARSWAAVAVLSLPRIYQLPMRRHLFNHHATAADPINGPFPIGGSPIAVICDLMPAIGLFGRLAPFVVCNYVMYLVSYFDTKKPHSHCTELLLEKKQRGWFGVR